jgi:uncharacterized membrane protein
MALYPIVGVAVGILLAVLISLYWIATLAIIVLPLAGFFLGRSLQKRSEARAS